MEEEKPDFEKHQYGNYILIPVANAALSSIEAAKECLMGDALIYIPEEFRNKIVWTINPQYKYKQGNRIHTVTSVGWKLGPIKGEV